jgi:8-oxo-dGTP pyrophosphatase MutT (NUDIX family)
MKLIMERFNKFLEEGQDMKRVAKIVLVREDDKILILKRARKLITEKSSPWEWDLSGGHAETDENLADTIVREVWEELSLSLGEVTEIYTEEETTFFVSYEWEGKIMLSNEHEEYLWINPKDVDNYNVGDKYSLAIGRITAR